MNRSNPRSAIESLKTGDMTDEGKRRHDEVVHELTELIETCFEQVAKFQKLEEADKVLLNHYLMGTASDEQLDAIKRRGQEDEVFRELVEAVWDDDEPPDSEPEPVSREELARGWDEMMLRAGDYHLIGKFEEIRAGRVPKKVSLPTRTLEDTSKPADGFFGDSSSPLLSDRDN